MLGIDRFNIRVYGIHVNNDGKVLVTDEYRLNMYMTKFPGGGLEFHEGTIDCLKRECMEELGCEIFNVQHFYTTDFFQPTTLVGKDIHQLISIYYLFDMRKPYAFSSTNKIYDFDRVEGAQTFRWIPIKELNQEMFSFPIDKKVAQMIYDRYL